MECRRIVPAREGWWRCAVGAVVSVGGCVAALAHVRVGYRPDARQPCAFGSQDRGLCTRHDGESRRHRSHDGTNLEDRDGPSPHRPSRAGVGYTAAPRRETLRVGPLAAGTFFSYGAAQETRHFFLGLVTSRTPGHAKVGLAR